MPTITEFRSYLNTKARRHTFYSYSTIKFMQDQAVFFILVEAYRKSRRKRQAIFINDWFINGNIPAPLTTGGYMGIVNVSADSSKAVNKSVTDSIAALGRTFADKKALHGGGVGGFFGALMQKAGDNKPSADLFEGPQSTIVKEIFNDGGLGFTNKGGAGAEYQPDHDYQPRGSYANQVILLKKELKTAGFDADDLGIY